MSTEHRTRSATAREDEEWVETNEGPGAQPRSGSVLLFYDLTEEALRLPGRTDIACIEGDADVIERAAALHLGLPRLPVAGVSVEHESLIELTSLAFDSLRRRTRLVEWVNRLYGSEDIEHFHRRSLLPAVDMLAALGHLINDSELAGYETIEVQHGWPSATSWRLLLDALREPALRERATELLGLDVVRALDRLVLPSPRRSPAVRNTRRAASAFLHVVGTWAEVLRMVSLRPRPLPSSRLVIRTYPTDWSSVPGEAERLRRVDFVVDGQELRTEEVVVWVEPGVGAEHRESLRGRGCRLLSADDVTIGLGGFFRRALPVLASFTARLPALARTDSWWHWPLALLVRDRVLWEEIARGLGPTAFLAYNDLIPNSVSRNVMLHRHGIPTVFYQHSSGTYSELDGEWRMNMVYPYLVFHAVATWGPKHVELARNHPGSIREFWDVGCLWSEHVRMVEADPAVLSRHAQELGPDRFERRVLAVDGTIESDLARRAWIALHHAVLQLARRMPEVLFVLKPKWPFEESVAVAGPEAANVVRGLEELENVAVLHSRFETAAAVALSDVVVGIPFTSVVLEAIGAGKPGVYYDGIAQFPTVFWRTIPGMVAADEDGLERRVRTLLWDTSPEAYGEYLQEHLADLEGHFDALGITRLRRRLLALTA